MKPQAKQKLSFAIDGVVGASVRQLAPVNASVRQTPVGKTNPNSSLAAASASASPAMMTAPSSPGSRPPAPPSTAGSVGASERQLAPVNTSERDQRIDKTNPPSLSERQLAAARLLASGMTPNSVAVQLGMSRTGLFKWRKQPAFLAEVRRIHEFMAYAYGTTVAQARAGGGGAGRSR
jgi:hypothetical protein